MGITAYNRGSRVLRQQIDRAAKVTARDAEPLNWTLQRDGLLSRIAELEGENAKALRCITSLRAQQTIDRQSMWQMMEEIASLKKERAEWAKALIKMRHRWQKASRIIRHFLSPQQVQRFRDEDSVAARREAGR